MLKVFFVWIGFFISVNVYATSRGGGGDIGSNWMTTNDVLDCSFGLRDNAYSSTERLDINASVALCRTSTTDEIDCSFEVRNNAYSSTERLSLEQGVNLCRVSTKADLDCAFRLRHDARSSDERPGIVRAVQMCKNIQKGLIPHPPEPQALQQVSGNLYATNIVHELDQSITLTNPQFKTERGFKSVEISSEEIATSSTASLQSICRMVKPNSKVFSVEESQERVTHLTCF